MVRADFPGGFAGDPKNKFQSGGRSVEENAAFDYVAKLANFRKSSSALGHGKLMQYIPSHGVYVYFRYDRQQTLLCALNTDTVVASIKFSDFSERTEGFETATDILSGHNYRTAEIMKLPARSFQILELNPRKDANKVVH